MGEVVLAEHLGLGKQVVVKLLHQELAKDPALVKRMQIEARSLAALASPHIVQVTDFGQTATGRTYIVMERLVGRTLGAEVKARGRAARRGGDRLHGPGARGARGRARHGHHPPRHQAGQRLPLRRHEGRAPRT